MRVDVIGGGPAGLYFAILMKASRPDAAVEVVERNRRRRHLRLRRRVLRRDARQLRGSADRRATREIRGELRLLGRHRDLLQGNVRQRSTGHGFCGLSREHAAADPPAARRGARRRGCASRREVPSVEAPRGARPRRRAPTASTAACAQQLAAHFQPDGRWRGRTASAGSGTTTAARGLHVHASARDEHGLFQVHAYPFEPGELRPGSSSATEETFKARRPRASSEAGDASPTARLFRRRPRRRTGCSRTARSGAASRRSAASAGTTATSVLLGDAAHTAHFSIGSGTKLAMEDAIALARRVRTRGRATSARARAPTRASAGRGGADPARGRQPRSWFENSRRYLGQRPGAVHLQPDDAQRSASPTTTCASATRELVARVDALVRASTAQRAALRPPTGSRAAADVRAVHAARHDAREPRRRLADVPVLGGRRRRRPTGTSCTSAAARSAARGSSITEMTDVSPRRPDHARLHRHVQRRARAPPGSASSSSCTRTATREDRPAARARRPQGLAPAAWEGDDRAAAPSGNWPTLAPSALPFYPGWPGARAS